MTQTIPKLILMRPKAQSLETLQALEKVLRRVPDHVIDPLVDIVTIPATLPLSFDCPIVFTSRHAVEIVSAMTMLRGDCICVGERVAKIAINNGFGVLHSFETVSDLIEFGLPQRVIYMRGEQVSCDLSDHCGSLTEVILYRQKPEALTLQSIKIMAEGGLVPVFSENAAKRLIQELGTNASQSTLVCISEKVAACFDPDKFDHVVVSSAPTGPAMIEKLAEFL